MTDTNIMDLTDPMYSFDIVWLIELVHKMPKLVGIGTLTLIDSNTITETIHRVLHAKKEYMARMYSINGETPEGVIKWGTRAPGSFLDREYIKPHLDNLHLFDELIKAIER